MQAVQLAPEQGRTRLIGSSGSIQRLRERIDRMAGLPTGVLLTGETGTGKGCVARMIHERSDRAERPFVHIDCAALSPSLIESELFGHEKGAFTNAVNSRAGRFELADRGTVFLDEIGDLARPLQAKLLRVLEDRQFERLGGNRTLTMRARVIAATSRDLEQEVRKGQFRSDLFYRLNIVRLRLPALRHRMEDIPELVEYACKKISRKLGIATVELPPDLVDLFSEHRWPGNVRELMNVVERVISLGDDFSADAADLDLGILEGEAENDRQDAVVSSPLGELTRAVSEVETQEILEALHWTGWNVTEAARRLGVPRGTLRYKIERHGIEPKRVS